MRYISTTENFNVKRYLLNISETFIIKIIQKQNSFYFFFQTNFNRRERATQKDNDHIIMGFNCGNCNSKRIAHKRLLLFIFVDEFIHDCSCIHFKVFMI